ncbi:biotin-dependent carboxyltransferase family protein [Photobacterium makurazakiensis]|uniref:5-oxoprolinase subunit C family protein n=1 Tax=Photobacterium makurazakiensis TaxID=2910234 RepID=UPI003D11A2A8
MATLEVIHAGMLSLVQDLGRFGVGSQGLSQGGPVDLHAYCWANHLVGNDANTPLIEITLGKASFKATSRCCVVITGADMSAIVDGTAVNNWQRFILNKGQVLSFGFAREGLRAYLAVSGGFNIPAVLGSCTTVSRNQLGGLKKGRPLMKGDSLPLNPMADFKELGRIEGQQAASRFVPDYGKPITLRVVESYQHAAFADSEKEAFYQSTYTVSQETDRMGCRLDGRAITADMNNGIVSEGIALGAIQIPPNGQPIVLLNDRQTLGGYPKLGCVARVDIPKLAQARPYTEVHFKPMPLAEATEEWLVFSRFFGLQF